MTISSDYSLIPYQPAGLPGGECGPLRAGAPAAEPKPRCLRPARRVVEGPPENRLRPLLTYPRSIARQTRLSAIGSRVDVFA